MENQPFLRVRWLVVAALLLSASAFVVMRGSGVPMWMPSWMPTVATITLAIVFALRAVGDFRNVGFFKRRRETGFARLDMLVYSPLCFCLSVGCAWIAFR